MRGFCIIEEGDKPADCEADGEAFDRVSSLSSKPMSRNRLSNSIMNSLVVEVSCSMLVVVDGGRIKLGPQTMAMLLKVMRLSLEKLSSFSRNSRSANRHVRCAHGRKGTISLRMRCTFSSMLFVCSRAISPARLNLEVGMSDSGRSRKNRLSSTATRCSSVTSFRRSSETVGEQ